MSMKCTKLLITFSVLMEKGSTNIWFARDIEINSNSLTSFFFGQKNLNFLLTLIYFFAEEEKEKEICVMSNLLVKD